MKFIDKHSWFTDYCYKIYIVLKKQKYTILAWRKSVYNYGYGEYLVLPYTSEHRKITNIKTFNKTWNENYPFAKSKTIEKESYDLSHKDFENYLKRKEVCA